MLAAVRACLENVVRHSGATVAEVELIADDRQVTVMVTDRGAGFDPAAVPTDRLGLRSSVAERMAAVGGTAKVFSAPGEGTSVIISAPVSQVGGVVTAGLFDRRFLRLSAQEVDPLSWFTGSLVPLVFAALNLAYGGVFAILSWAASPNPIVQIVGVLLCSSACVLVHVLTRPMRRRIGWPGAIVAVGIATCGFILSALGYAGSVLTIELWWAPFGLALTIGSLGPYLPARVIVTLGTLSALIAIPVAFVAIQPEVTAWGPVATVVIISSPIVSGIVATAAFSIAVVGRTLPLIEKRTQTMLSLDTPGGMRNQTQERRPARPA